MDELKNITEALEGLQGGVFKDYVYPVTIAFFSTLLGASVAYLTVRRQEYIQQEKSKLEIANRWILRMEEARTNLFSIKRNYHGELSAHPFQRATVIPTNPLKHKVIDEDYIGLTFIMPKKLRKGKMPYRWSQITRIRAVLANYNELMLIWERRHALHEEFISCIREDNVTHMSDGLAFEKAIELYGPDRILRLIDNNEQAIVLTDRLLEELTDFVVNFPHYVKTMIDLKRLKRVGTLVGYYGDTTRELDWLLVRSPQADFKTIEFLVPESEAEIERRFNNLV